MGPRAQHARRGSAVILGILLATLALATVVGPPLGQSPHPRPPHRDRPHAQAQPARLPEAVAVPLSRVHPASALIAPASQQRLDLLLQDPLHQVLHPLAGERLQVLPATLMGEADDAYSNTSSALVRTAGGIVRPSAWATDRVKAPTRA